MRNKKVMLISTILLVCLACIFSVFAHSGRTDSNGGHRDYSNQSGLGSYHYHCGGYPAHLHKNGYCPYKSYSSSSYTNSSDDYDDGYDDGYQERIYDAAAEREKEFNIVLVSILIIVAIVLLVKFIKKHRKQ